MTDVNHDPAKFHVGLKVLLVNDRDEFLLLKAVSQNSSWHNTWDLPGGRINQDEIDIDFHEIIDREIKEEVGEIKYNLRPDPVALAKCKYENDDSERFFILFEAKYLNGEIKLCHEHSEHAWMKITPKTVNENFHQVLKQLMSNYFKWNR